MNMEELDGLLVDKLKSCVSGKRLPDGFSERMISEIRRSRRALRIRVVSASVIVIVLCSVVMGLLAESPGRGPKETALVAAREGGTKEKVSGWMMLLGVFRECFKRSRTSKRKEEY